MVEKNLFKNIPDFLPDEISEVLLQQQNIRIERIVSQGHTSPLSGWYDQEENEWVILLQGAAEIIFENDRSIKLEQGTYINIPSHIKHKVRQTSSHPKCIWLAIFYK